MSTKPSKKPAAKAGETLSLPAPVGGFAHYEEISGAGKDTIAALLEANTALAAGLEKLGGEVIELTRDAFESAAAAGVALLDAKTVEDVMAVNNDYAKRTLEKLIACASRISELGFEAASAAYQPLGARFEKAMGDFAKPLAA